jgi:phosphomethylpyrimidine synthase
MEAVARDEQVAVDILLKRIAEGTVVIPCNVNRDMASIRAVGLGLRTKVNANIGTSPDYPDIKDELLKLKTAVDAGNLSSRDARFLWGQCRSTKPQ